MCRITLFEVLQLLIMLKASGTTLIRTIITVYDNDVFPSANISKAFNEGPKDSEHVNLPKSVKTSFLMRRS